MAEGDNYIEGVAGNDNGSYKWEQPVIVTRNATVDFTGKINFSEEGTEEDEPIDVVASVPISPFRYTG